MPKKLYVGNLPFSATEEEVRNMFAAHGEVMSVALISDKMTGRPRGFGFVEMEGAEAAAAALNGKEMNGRALIVNEAREREAGGGGAGGGGGGGNRRFGGGAGGGGGGGGGGGRRFGGGGGGGGGGRGGDRGDRGGSGGYGGGGGGRDRW